MTKTGATWRTLAAAKPAVFNIPARVAFVDVLAQGILDDTGGDPLALAAVTVLLPTRRACRSLREAFLRLSNGVPLLLPRLLPLSDIDDDESMFVGFATADTVEQLPPPVAPLKRQLLLARLIQTMPLAGGDKPPPEQALRLADELARLLDQVQTERLTFDRLKDLVPDEYADHWRTILRFLAIITSYWPDILAENGALDPAEHRNRVFAAQGAVWRMASGPIIAAGSTGSIPATADLLATVAALPQGCVVLPGLDRYLSDDHWTEVDEAHPQYGLKHLLAHIGVSRDQVRTWPTAPAGSDPREDFISEVLRPAATTDAWRSLPAVAASAIEGLVRVDCPGAREEAEVIGLAMREALEREGQTCALVTPDRRLAERVGAELKRWKIEINDSAGRSLDRTPTGTFLRLTAAMVATSFAPVPLLAACKHPLAAAGLDVLAFRALTREAEREMLRGPRPASGLDGLRSIVPPHGSRRARMESWIAHLDRCCAEFAALMSKPRVPLGELLEAHMQAAEALAATIDDPGPLRLWAGDEGEAMAAFAAELAQNCDVLEPIAPPLYPGVLDTLMSGKVVRPRFGQHPRLSILGPLEARLQRFDVLILGGLNEGTWPSEPAADPWMSRPMRRDFGLPSPERRIGLAAHDIAQALCAPRVLMTRALKSDGAPTVPSRWLMRLRQVVKAAGLETHWDKNNQAWLTWAQALSYPTSFAANRPPAPTPPVAARPRQLSVTQIETWMRDPYGIYARCILGLKALDPLDQDVSLADYGSLVHGALQHFIEAHPAGPLPPDAHEQLCALGRTEFAGKAVRPAVMAFWWPRFERITAWFIAHESERRTGLTRSFVERKGALKVDGPAGPFTIVGKADRIDQAANGALTIIDYKTGAVPHSKEVLAGYAPQLPLEGAIAMAGGFPDVPQGRIGELAYWHLHGRKAGGEACVIKGDATALAAEQEERLRTLIATFDNPNTPYQARPMPEMAPKYSDYTHLARVKEWASAGEDEDS